jgi:hypothetical protein
MCNCKQNLSPKENQINCNNDVDNADHGADDDDMTTPPICIIATFKNFNELGLNKLYDHLHSLADSVCFHKAAQRRWHPTAGTEHSHS